MGGEAFGDMARHNCASEKSSENPMREGSPQMGLAGRSAGNVSLHLTGFHFQSGQQQRVSTQDRPSSRAIKQDSVELESLNFMEDLPNLNAGEVTIQA